MRFGGSRILLGVSWEVLGHVLGVGGLGTPFEESLALLDAAASASGSIYPPYALHMRMEGDPSAPKGAKSHVKWGENGSQNRTHNRC